MFWLRRRLMLFWQFRGFFSLLKTLIPLLERRFESLLLEVR